MTSSPVSRLAPQLLERVLDRLNPELNLALPGEPSLDALQSLYAAWCERVPFDNVRKISHLHHQLPGALPGAEAVDFFEAWLKHGTGGTCWAGSGALHALLESTGYSPERGLATMLAAPHLPPNHATVSVTLEGQRYLLDSAMLHRELLPLDEGQETRVTHAAWGLSAMPQEGRWSIQWRPLHQPAGFECRLEHFSASDTDYVTRYEATRDWSPFNYQVYARRNRGDTVFGLAMGQSVRLAEDGAVVETPVDDAERRRMLIEDFGMSEEIVARLPEDRPTPPPPGSRTAEAGGL